MKTIYHIRKATDGDIDVILNMFDYSRSVMRADGNTGQWVGYPTRADVEADVRRGVSYLVESGKWKVENETTPPSGAPLSTLHSPLSTFHFPLSTPIGTFALVPGEEPTYGYIDHGRWIDPTRPYCTLHRLAAMPGTSGIAAAAFAFAKGQSDYLRVDTHATNRPMRHILEREGFVKSGIIYMPDGGPRDAFEWWRYDEVPADLKQYVEEAVLPRYDHFDPAHRRDHARRVIARALEIVESGKWKVESEPGAAALLSTSHFPLSTSTYVAAAMHDLGLAEGREEHHLASGRIIRADRELRRWFGEEDVELIAQAAEDHRASAQQPPRSLLGCIVAEADRDIEPETIVRRTVEYGLGHYPDLDRDGHWLRTLDHLHEKYAEGGYIRLWMDRSPNMAPLADLRALIRDEARLRTLFDSLFDTLTTEEPLKNQNSKIKI